MTILEPGKPFRTRESSIKVENRFEPGEYRFQLSVFDDEGNQSAPAVFTVRVVNRDGRVVIRDDVVINPDISDGRLPRRPTPPIFRPQHAENGGDADGHPEVDDPV